MFIYNYSRDTTLWPSACTIVYNTYEECLKELLEDFYSQHGTEKDHYKKTMEILRLGKTDYYEVKDDEWYIEYSIAISSTQEWSLLVVVIENWYDNKYYYEINELVIWYLYDLIQ